MKKEDIEELIYRVLKKDCTEQEFNELEEWRNCCANNQRMYDEIKNIVETGGYLKGMERLDKAKALSIVMKRVKRNTSLRVRLLRYAAALLIPVCLAGGVYMWFDSREVYHSRKLSINKQIQAGTPKAILYLSDGKSVVLNDTCDSVITDGVEGREITLANVDNKLDYSKNVREADSEERVVYNKVLVPRGGEYMLILADGTRVWLNSDTWLEYPLAFGTGAREVKLRGEAFFEVAKDAVHPFKVAMEGGATIEVTGTSFNASCYPEEGVCRAVLESGKINLRANGQLKGVGVGECAVYDCMSQEITVAPVNLKYYTAWRQGTFYFYDTPLSEIVRSLGRWYDVKFTFADSSLQQVRFSGAALRSKPLDFILRLLESTHSLRFEIQEDNSVLVEKR